MPKVPINITQIHIMRMLPHSTLHVWGDNIPVDITRYGLHFFIVDITIYSLGLVMGVPVDITIYSLIIVMDVQLDITTYSLVIVIGVSFDNIICDLTLVEYPTRHYMYGELVLGYPTRHYMYGVIISQSTLPHLARISHSTLHV